MVRRTESVVSAGEEMLFAVGVVLLAALELSADTDGGCVADIDCAPSVTVVIGTRTCLVVVSVG